MLLKEFLKLITDENIDVELVLDIESEPSYIYTNFWLSEFRNKESSYYKKYNDWVVEDFSLTAIMYYHANISIQIKPSE